MLLCHFFESRQTLHEVVAGYVVFWEFVAAPLDLEVDRRLWDVCEFCFVFVVNPLVPSVLSFFFRAMADWLLYAAAAGAFSWHPTVATFGLIELFST